MPAVTMRYIAGDDPLIGQVEDLCYATLHEPFGVTRQDGWDQMDPFSRHLVAIDDDLVVGYARLIREGEWGHLRQVVVEPGYRGRGIGTALVDELVEEARRQGIGRLYLNSRMPAVNMYERAGFRVVSPEPFPMPRTYLPHVRMER
ncbi:MAG TPA: GNAT family N-acetyltransferase, partial [Coriobacteriia bacterium]